MSPDTREVLAKAQEGYEKAARQAEERADLSADEARRLREAARRDRQVALDLAVILAASDG